MKKIAKILFWSVLFVWMIFLQPQNVMAAEADEIIKELDFTDINAQTQDLPEKMDFEKMVNKLVTEGTVNILQIYFFMKSRLQSPCFCRCLP